MKTNQVLWKRCIAAGVALLSCLPLAAGQEKHPTAREIGGRIQAHVGVPWQTDTVDTFKAGNPDEAVTGIAVTMMATMDVLERAAASGKNLVITHEPTFYNHLDKLDVLPEKEKDPVLAAKLAFIAEHHLVVWRFHDHWHRRTPDGIEAGMAYALGWEKQEDPEHQYLFAVPETTLESLAADLKKKARYPRTASGWRSAPQDKESRPRAGRFGIAEGNAGVGTQRRGCSGDRRASRMGNC